VTQRFEKSGRERKWPLALDPLFYTSGQFILEYISPQPDETIFFH